MKTEIIHTGCGKVAFFKKGPSPVAGEKIIAEDYMGVNGEEFIDHSPVRCTNCGGQIQISGMCPNVVIGKEIEE